MYYGVEVLLARHIEVLPASDTQLKTYWGSMKSLHQWRQKSRNHATAGFTSKSQEKRHIKRYRSK